MAWLRHRRDASREARAGADGCVRRWAGEQLGSAGRCRLLRSGAVVACALIDDTQDDFALCATERGTILTCVPGAADTSPMRQSPARRVDQAKVAAVVVSGHFGAITALAAHPATPIFATAGADGRVLTWDADMGVKLHQSTLEHCGSALKYDEKGRFLFVGTDAGTVAVLDATTLECLRTTPAFKCPVTALTASPDGTLIVACSRRGDVVVLDKERVLVELRSGSGAAAVAADFGRDQKRRLVFRTRGDDGVVDSWRLGGSRSCGRCGGAGRCGRSAAGSANLATSLPAHSSSRGRAAAPPSRWSSAWSTFCRRASASCKPRLERWRSLRSMT